MLRQCPCASITCFIVIPLIVFSSFLVFRRSCLSCRLAAAMFFSPKQIRFPASSARFSHFPENPPKSRAPFRRIHRRVFSALLLYHKKGKAASVFSIIVPLSLCLYPAESPDHSRADKIQDRRAISVQTAKPPGRPCTGYPKYNILSPALKVNLRQTKPYFIFWNSYIAGVGRSCSRK